MDKATASARSPGAVGENEGQANVPPDQRNPEGPIFPTPIVPTVQWPTRTSNPYDRETALRLVDPLVLTERATLFGTPGAEESKPRAMEPASREIGVRLGPTEAEPGLPSAPPDRSEQTTFQVISFYIF